MKRKELAVKVYHAMMRSIVEAHSIESLAMKTRLKRMQVIIATTELVKRNLIVRVRDEIMKYRLRYTRNRIAGGKLKKVAR